MKKGSTAAAHARKSHMCLWRENLSGHEAEKKVHTHARLVCCTRARGLSPRKRGWDAHNEGRVLYILDESRRAFSTKLFDSFGGSVSDGTLLLDVKICDFRFRNFNWLWGRWQGRLSGVKFMRKYLVALKLSEKSRRKIQIYFYSFL